MDACICIFHRLVFNNACSQSQLDNPEKFNSDMRLESGLIAAASLLITELCLISTESLLQTQSPKFNLEKVTKKSNICPLWCKNSDGIYFLISPVTWTDADAFITSDCRFPITWLSSVVWDCFHITRGCHKTRRHMKCRTQYGTNNKWPLWSDCIQSQ